MTIVEFLEARLAEDEAVARSAFIDHEPRTAEWIERGNEVVNADGSLVVSRTWNEVTHIARQDPSRALREVAAKRGILTEYVNECWVQEQGHRTAWTEGGQSTRETAIRLFVAIYSDHPDYQQEWAL